MTQEPHPRVVSARQKVLAQAEAMGVDDAFVSRLVDEFYVRVRRNPDLRPIFEGAIGENWDAHMPKMKDFWASVAWAAGRYHGNPVQVHKCLKGVTPEHFETWLRLFKETLIDIAPTREARDFFVQRSEMIAQSLQMGMFYSPHEAEGNS